MVLDKIEGRWGTAWRIPLPEGATPVDWKATVDHWLIYSPNAHPLWHYFFLSCVHLRDLEGQSRPPVKRTDDATHEVLLVALDPAYEPWDPDMAMDRMWKMFDQGESIFLTPINMVKQLRSATDEQAAELMQLIAKGITIGYLPLEPDGVLGGRDWWYSVIDKTMEHMRLGTHPSEN